MTGSWRTTMFGLIAGIGAAVVTALQTGIIDPTTLPVWVKGVFGLLAVIGTAGLGIVSRDNKVTSEEAGATKSPNP